MKTLGTKQSPHPNNTCTYAYRESEERFRI